MFRAFAGQRRVLLIATKSKKPTQPTDFMPLIQTMQESVLAVSDIKDKNRGSPTFHHLSAVSESMDAFSWIVVEAKPHKHVEESLGSAQYWGNRILKEYKDK